MKTKVIVASTVIVFGLVFGALSFIESNVEYTDIRTAKETHKKVQVKGEWLKEKKSQFDAGKGQFIFYMRDDNAEEVKVVLDGAKPNNFEIASSIVVKGRYRDDHFHATEILTKCPSKYEGDSESVRKTL